MSDGPHRTLPLRHVWRQLAKRAAYWAYDRQDVIDAICPALERDCAWELPKDFMRELHAACADEEPSLFGRSLLGLDELRRGAAGPSTLRNTIAAFAGQGPLAGRSR